jgi:hypothetical protein
MNHAVDRIVDVFQTLTPTSVEALDEVYAPQARFKDPFNDVRGPPEIQRIFRHMFVSLNQPRFIITERIVQGGQCFLTWEFRFTFKNFKQGQEQCILGGSHLVLDDAGRITLHRDYWDAAEELYEKLPLVGGLMRWLKARANS